MSHSQTAQDMPPAPKRPTKFVEYVLNAGGSSTEVDKLEKWFTKLPKKERTLIPEAPIESDIKDAGTSYVGRPYQLHRPPLIRQAEKYYPNDTALSRFMIWLITILLFIPALVVYAMSHMWHSFKHNQSQAEQNAENPQVPSEKPTPAPPVGRRAWEFKNPWLFARSWSLWVVYVPITRYFGGGGLKGALLPSHSPKFQNDQAEAIKLGGALLEKARTEVKHLRKLHRHSVVNRRKCLELTQAKLDELEEMDERDEEEEKLRKNALHATYGQLLNDYRDKTKIALELQRALEAAEQEVELVRNAANTETCASATNYKGVADWAQDALDAYSNVLTAMISVCFVGAGLTYSAIFSATRGSLGLMSWSFSLFLVGLAILITVQSLLMWCSRVDNYPFSTPSIWELALGFSVYGASAAVVAAIVLLVVTVLDLNFNGPLNNIGSMNGNSTIPWNGTRHDAPLVFSVPPKGAAIAAFSAIGVGVAIAIIVFVFFAVSNSPQTLLWRRSIERSRKPRVRLADFV